MDREVRSGLSAPAASSAAVVDRGTERFPKRRRIRRSTDFTEIIRRGAFAADDTLVVNLQRRDSGDIAPESMEGPGVGRGTELGSRLGITIPKKVGSAPIRNRWKRWIREAFRKQQACFPPGLQIVVRPKRDAVGSYQAVAKSLVRNVRRAAARLKSAKP